MAVQIVHRRGETAGTAPTVTAISDTDRAAVEGYLMQKRGIT